MKKSFLVLTFVLFLSNTTLNAQKLQSEDYLNIKSNLEFLADDLLEGRNAASRGEKIASLFIASEFQKYGVKPFGDNGTYFQNFDLKIRKLTNNSKVALYNSDGLFDSDLTPGADYLIDGSKIPFNETLNKPIELVFAGYGITAEEFGYDDYKNIDAEGKIVILLSGEPYSDSEDYFEGDKFTKHAGPKTKLENAQAHGAVGIINIVNERLKPYWGVLWSMYMIGKMGLVESEIGVDDVMPTVILSEEGAAKIFNSEMKNFDEIKSALDQHKQINSFELIKQIALHLEFEDYIGQARNVIGIIEGKDPILKNEYVTMGAHYDHVDIFDGDVCNGADDNGSGVVAVMQTAKEIAMKNENNRSIIFILYTGEEKGLLGSYYFTNNFEKIDDVVANINVDMCSREDVNSIYCIGADRTSKELNDIVDLSNKETSNFTLDYSLSNTRVFELSDHFPYVAKNIPVVFFFDNMLEDLHKPGDELHKVSYEKIVKTKNLAKDIVLKTANLDHRLEFNFAE